MTLDKFNLYYELDDIPMPRLSHWQPNAVDRFCLFAKPYLVASVWAYFVHTSTL